MMMMMMMMMMIKSGNSLETRKQNICIYKETTAERQIAGKHWRKKTL
jgi:hypothetical protein